MATEKQQAIRDFVREDGNEAFEHRPERICPSCGIDRKTLIVAIVNGGYEDRCAAGSIIGSCSQCAEAVEDILDELHKRQDARRQAHCSRCGSRMVEATQDGLHCVYCGHIAYSSQSLPYVSEKPEHYGKRKESTGAAR